MDGEFTHLFFGNIHVLLFFSHIFWLGCGDMGCRKLAIILELVISVADQPNF